MEASIIPFFIGITIAAFFVYYGLKGRAEVRRIRKYDLLSPRGMTEGSFVGITGRVEAEKPLTGPVSRKRVVFYKTEIFQGEGKSRVSAYKEQESIPFVIADGSGRVEIDLSHPMYCNSNLLEESRIRQDYDDYAADVKQHFVPATEKTWHRVFDATERGIEEGQVATVFGYVRNGKIGGVEGKWIWITQGEKGDLLKTLRSRGRITLFFALVFIIFSIFAAANA